MRAPKVNPQMISLKGKPYKGWTCAKWRDWSPEIGWSNWFFVAEKNGELLGDYPTKMELHAKIDKRETEERAKWAT